MFSRRTFLSLVSAIPVGINKNPQPEPARYSFIQLNGSERLSIRNNNPKFLNTEWIVVHLDKRTKINKVEYIFRTSCGIVDQRILSSDALTKCLIDHLRKYYRETSLWETPDTRKEHTIQVVAVKPRAKNPLLTATCDRRGYPEEL